MHCPIGSGPVQQCCQLHMGQSPDIDLRVSRWWRCIADALLSGVSTLIHISNLLQAALLAVGMAAGMGPDIPPATPRMSPAGTAFQPRHHLGLQQANQVRCKASSSRVPPKRYCN